MSVFDDTRKLADAIGLRLPSDNLTDVEIGIVIRTATARILDKKREVSDEAVNGLRACIETARVVGVLDAWAVGAQGRHELEAFHDKSHCVLTGYVVLGRPAQTKRWSAETPDAARAAAAKAIEAGEV